MARKIDPENPAAPASDAAAPNPLDDLFTLMPDVELEVAGRKLIVHEASFALTQRFRARAGALIDDLTKLVDDGTAAEAGIETYLDVLARHQSVVDGLMVDSIDGADIDFIQRLNQLDGQRLLATWWTVTGRFFWRAVVGRLRDRTLVELRRQASAGSTSSSPSPAPPAPNSAASPNATASVN